MRIQSPTLGLAVCLAAGLGLSASFASATTVTWDFSHPTGQLGTSKTYGSVITPPTGEVVGITAYGYEQQTTTGGSSSFNRKRSYGPKSSDLYGKDSGTSESGLGISNDSDHEIDYTVTSGHASCGHRTKTIFQSFIQLDLKNAIEAFPNIADATITIGSLQNPDTAVLSYSNKLGHIGTQIEQVSYKHATDGVSTVSLNLSHFSLADPYLTISSAGPSCCYQSCCHFSSSVLLDSGELSYTSATPTPEPAAAGLLGFAAMGLGLMPRRRTK